MERSATQDTTTRTPDAAPPGTFVRPLWNERSVDWSGVRQLRFRMPVLGWFTGPAFGYHVGVELGRRWERTQPFEGLIVQAVAGHCDERVGRRCLTVLVTFDAPRATAHRVDGPAIARDVEAAVALAARLAHQRLQVL